jgi:D-inositol-3-phosphate glycosyltransferase
MEAQPHLLFFGWHVDGTGFTRVLRALVPFFCRHFRVTWMGVGYQGEPRELAPGVLLRPTNLNGGDLMGAYAARLEWEALAPDAVFALNDPWYLAHYSREIASRLGSIPMVGYLPLDGDFVDSRVVDELTGFSALFTYTRHAASQLRGALRACGNDTPVGVAGHGVDLSAFRPAPAARQSGFAPETRMQLARDLFGLDEPSWVVLNASRPDPRKRIDISIDGFARFVRERPANVRLCLHQALSNAQFVEPLRQQADALGLAGRILWWPPQHAPLDDNDLCALYNACAAGLNTSLGEGFGLVSFEHAATGVPQLVPAHPALSELWGDAAVCLGPVRKVTTDHSPFMMGEVTPEQVSDGLERIYNDDAEYRRLSHLALERSSADDLRWEPVATALLEALSSRASSRSAPSAAAPGTTPRTS